MRVPNSIKDLVDPELPSGALAKGVGLWGDERRLTPASGELVRPDQPINAAEKNTPGRSRGRREGKGLIEADSNRKGIQIEPEEPAPQID